MFKQASLAAVIALAGVVVLSPTLSDAHEGRLRSRMSSGTRRADDSRSNDDRGGSSNSGSSGSSSSGGSTSGGGGQTVERRLRLEARMRQGATELKLAYDDRTSRRKFQAEVYRGVPMSSYTVSHNGSTIATVQTDSAGFGRAELHFGGDDLPQGNVPVMRAGDTITIGSASGILRPK